MYSIWKLRCVIEILDVVVAEKKIVMTRDSSGKGVTKELSETKSKEQVLANHEVKKLAEFALKLEEHYQKPQDIEFSIENGEIKGPGKSVRIIHNIATMLKNISAIGNNQRNVIQWASLPSITPSIKAENISVNSI